MIDELDLGFDEHGAGREGPAPARLPQAQAARGGGGRGKTFLRSADGLGPARRLGGGAFFGFDQIKDFFVAADYDGAGHR